MYKWYWHPESSSYVCSKEEEMTDDLVEICEAEEGDENLRHTPRWVIDEHNSQISDRLTDMEDSLLGDGDDY